MSKFAQAFGESYQQHKLSIISRSFQLGEHTFKVRVPSVGEIEDIFNYENKISDADIDVKYNALISTLKTLDNDNIVKSDNDIVIDGRSMRETAKTQLVLQHRILQYFKLLIPENGQSLDDLTYEDIQTEFPIAIQMQFIDKINEVISPDYKESRGK